ncbi:MAG: hypothetical protein C0407_11110 [Desulfobacca sp.]|nr:hypothetical protein [Desulfobacca sp.]
MWSRMGIVVLVIAAFFLMGMGKLDQTEKPGEIPVPDKEVSVSITDNEGLTLNLNQFSINGQILLAGKLGAGRVTMPLSQIRVISLSNGAKGIFAKIELTDHSQMNLLLEKGAMIFGKIKVGTYQVSLDHLKKIEILGISDKKK